MKKLPADTTITNFEYPAYESDRHKLTPHLADLPKVEGFTPFDAPETTQVADIKPVVQAAVFQDFAKIIQAD